MARLAAIFLTLVTAFACAGDESAPLGTYGELCDETHACVQGLVCLNRFCTAKCEGTNGLTCAQAGAGDTCVGGVCYTACDDVIDCPAGLKCTMFASKMGTCRP